MADYNFSGWATKNDLLCSDGRVIRHGAFKHHDGQRVPLVWNHDHTDPYRVVGYAELEHRDEGVYAYGYFNNTDLGQTAKEYVEHGDITQLSIYANQLKQQGNNVIHGCIREVSLVMSGANPGAFIENVIKHSDDSDEPLVNMEEARIFTGEDIIVHHADESETEVEEVETSETEVNETETQESNEVVDNNETIEHSEESSEEGDKETVENNEKTIKEIYDGMSDEQKDVVHALVGMALEDDDDEENEIEHSEGGNETMKTNVFDPATQQNTNVLSHADERAILELAKSSGVGSLKAAMEIFAAENTDKLAHGWDAEDIKELFPDYKDVHPGAPELLERDQSWVGLVMRKAHKSPISRIRTRQADARANELRAKGYNDRKVAKTLSGDLKLIMRTTDPQTVYRRDELHRDDINDITDFDVVAYQKVVMRHNLEEDIALAALIGDGREDTDPDKIHENHIRPIWNDEELYTIHADVDIEAARAELQGTNTNANFGENYIYAEAIISAALYAREKYKGKGTLDFFCTPHLLNVMLLARDLNGRRIYDSKTDLAKALNVGEIHTVEQFEGKTRTTKDGGTKKLLGIFVNMANYQFGSTKGGEITNFEDFDIDFNKYKYLMETRLSGALIEVYSAIALEEPVTEVAAG